MTTLDGYNCPRCGRPLEDGHCRHCMHAVSDGPGTLPADVFGPIRVGSVLETLSVTMDRMPRVMLPDTDGDLTEQPPINASSIEMPAMENRPVRVQLLGEIARGGMGVVLKGRDPDLGRDLAVKVLLDSHQQKPDMVRRFVEEAQIAGQLQHPGVVPVYELGSFGDRRPYFTMKLVKGQTLAELLNARGSADDDLSRFLGIFEQMCQTMAYAHARDVIHRDLKPSNVMVGSFGEVQVMDWGLAKVMRKGGVVDDAAAGKIPTHDTVIATARVDSDVDLSQAGSVMGTPAYMAPEQARGELALVDERADVFSLGSILCEILTGKPAFIGRTVGEVHRKAAVGDVADAVSRLNQGAGIDAELAALAIECLAREPEDRIRHAGLVAQRITTYRAEVDEKLRAAEIARATEEARAEEEAKRRVLADELAREAQAHAEESQRTAEAAEAKAKAERRAKRMTGAFALTILGLVLAIGSGSMFIQKQWAERQAQLDLALRDAEILYNEAKRRGDDPARWRAAREAAHAAERLLADARDGNTRNRVTALVQSVTAAANAAENDQKLLDRLVEIRASTEDDTDWSLTDAAYETAFRNADLDFAKAKPSEIGEKIKGRTAAIAGTLSAALDDWAMVRRDKRRNRPGAEQLTEAARAADPDPWRNQLRDALNTTSEERRLAALRGLANSARTDQLPAVSLDLLGTALRENGEPTLAESILRKAQRRYPGDVWLNYSLGLTLEKLARRKEAIRYYMAAHAIRPEVAHELAHALDQSGEFEEAIAVFQELTRIRPDTGRHYRCLGIVLQRRGRTKEASIAVDAAIAILRKDFREKPEYARFGLNLGGALSHQGKHAEAVTVYRESLTHNPDDAPLHNALGVTLRSLGKIDEAMREFQEAIRLKRDYPDPHVGLGYLLTDDKHDLIGGEAEIRKAIAIKPDDHSTHEALGLNLHKQRKLKEAIEELRKASKIDPSCGGAHRMTGDVMRDQGADEDAIAEYHTAMQLQPSDQNALYYYDLLLKKAGRAEQALIKFRELIRLHPQVAAPRNLLAWNLVVQRDRTKRDLDEALDNAREAMRIEPEIANHPNTLALAEYRVGHWDESIAASEKSIALSQGISASDWFFMAMCHFQKGNQKEAAKWFDKAVAWTKENDPKNEELRQFWTEAAELLKQPGPPALSAPASTTEKPR